MTKEYKETCRYFISYSGVGLPLKLVTPLGEEDLDNRNTFFRACFDESNVLLRCQKLVYGDVELEHVYSYHANGKLMRAEITDADGDIEVLSFDDQGKRIH